MCKAHHRHHGVIMRVTSWDTHMISNDVRTLDVHIMSKGHDIWHQEFFHHLISCSHTHWYHMTPSDDVPSSECHGISLSMFQDHSWGCMSMIDPLGLSLCIHIRSQEPGEHSGDHMICFAYHKLLLSYSLCEVTLTSLMKHRVDDATSSTLQTNYPLRGRLRSTPTYQWYVHVIIDIQQVGYQYHMCISLTCSHDVRRMGWC